MSMNLLKLYFGDDIKVNDYITLRHPLVNDMVVMGENEYFNFIHIFTSTPSDMKPFLYDNFNIIWEDVTDYEVFVELLLPQMSKEDSLHFFNGLDLTSFKKTFNYETGEFVLIDGNKVFDRLAYTKISDALRFIHGMKKNVETAATKTVQKILIDDDRRREQREKALANKEEGTSQMITLISSLINCSDFKYGLKEIREMPMYAFMDAISRVQIVRNTTALLHGCYSGMIDMKAINKNELNFMREIKKPK